MSSTQKATKVVPIGFADVTVHWSLEGDADELICTYGIDVLAPPLTSADVAVMSGPWETFWETPGTFPADYHYLGLSVSVPTDGPGPMLLEFSTDVPGAGGSGSGVPQNTTFLVKKNTAFGGRRNRGRMYLPGVGESIVGPTGTVSGGAHGVISNGLDDLFTTLHGPGTNTADIVIFHSYPWTGDVDPGPPVGFPAPTPCTSWSLDNTVASQRRRLR